MSKDTVAKPASDAGKDERRTAAYWRQQAAEARASARELEDGEAKATLENIAAMYESMAKLTELNKEGADS